MYIINKKLLCDDLFAAAVVAVAAGVVASYEAERRLRWCQEEAAAESRGNWAEDDDEKAVEAAEALADLQRRLQPS